MYKNNILTGFTENQGSGIGDQQVGWSIFHRLWRKKLFVVACHYYVNPVDPV